MTTSDMKGKQHERVRKSSRKTNTTHDDRQNQNIKNKLITENELNV